MPRFARPRPNRAFNSSGVAPLLGFNDFAGKRIVEQPHRGHVLQLQARRTLAGIQHGLLEGRVR